MSNKTFETEIVVRFPHVDPAGIVFYPKYVEMVNHGVETWFEQALECDYRVLHFERGFGIPTARLELDFLAPSRLGDRLTLQLQVTHLGTSSFHLRQRLLCAGSLRLAVVQKLVLARLEPFRPEPIPADLRQRMSEYLVVEA